MGMGGPLSPFGWNLSFDPLVWASQLAFIGEVLAYVDDLLSLVVGPGQTILAYLVLLALTKRAGLEVAEHTCCRTVICGNTARVQSFLEQFP